MRLPGTHGQIPTQRGQTHPNPLAEAEHYDFGWNLGEPKTADRDALRAAVRIGIVGSAVDVCPGPVQRGTNCSDSEFMQ